MFGLFNGKGNMPPGYFEILKILTNLKNSLSNSLSDFNHLDYRANKEDIDSLRLEVAQLSNLIVDNLEANPLCKIPKSELEKLRLRKDLASYLENTPLFIDHLISQLPKYLTREKDSSRKDTQQKKAA